MRSHGHDVLKGGQGTDYLYGGSGNDQIFGNDGIDWLYGESGDDYLNGGGGADHIDGGSGTNTFRRDLFLPGSGFSLTGKKEDKKEDEKPGDIPAEVAEAFLSEVAGPDDMFDIDQAGTPTCAFLTTLSSVARSTGTTNDLVAGIQYNPANDTYGITLFVWGTRATQVLGRTIRVPAVVSKTVWVNGDWTEGRDPGGKLWVTLYQKAYLQLLGATTRDAKGACLDSTQWKSAGGKEWNHVSETFFALTGKAADFVKIASANAKSMFDQLGASKSKGMVASSLDSGTSAGIVANHCYSVYKIFQDAKGNWLVRLRNPWGEDGRDGAMYDRNSEKQQFANDGLNTLTWSQFTANFRGYYKA